MFARPMALLCCFAACQPKAPADPSDDPLDYPVDSSVQYQAVLGEPKWLIPSSHLPKGLFPRASNNNVDLHFFHGRLYLAWRTAPTHFASTETKMQIISSDDDGERWRLEKTIEMGCDMREPSFTVIGDVLRFQFFQAGSDPVAFTPITQWRTTLKADGTWSELESWGPDEEISWNVKLRGGALWRTSYAGTHYDLGATPDIRVSFTRSTDGTTWSNVKGDGVVYRGGVSEVAFEFAADGSLWAVTRNEDGDSTGFGSHVCTAPKDDLGTWACSARSNPQRYDSPKMFRHGDELYLVARRDVGGQFDENRADLSFADQQRLYLLDYWYRPKRTALYRINQETHAIEWVLDFPSSGDTAFPSVIRVDAHRWLIANYTSPLDDLNTSWVDGQTSDKGTQIYLIELRFDAK